MYDIKNMKIWENEPANTNLKGASADADLEELELSVRSFNCLKRAGCNTVRDVLVLLEEDDNLRRVRNLGTKSEQEIREKVELFRERMANEADSRKKKALLIKPARKFREMEIEDFGISSRSVSKFHQCGIRIVEDLYEDHLKGDPGWYAVRELFENIPIIR